MMANPKPHQIDEEDMDILALRAAALSSLSSKETKKDPQNDRNHMSYQGFHQNPSSLNHSMAMHEHPNGMTSMNYGRPCFPNQGPDMFLHQPMYNHQHQQRMIMRPNFAPRRPTFQPPIMPSVQPHLNPHFISQNVPMPSNFPPGSLEMHLKPPAIGQDEDMPLIIEKNGFIPTPTTRLSPRSAQFVAENHEALRRSRRRSPSPLRSRSRSPYKRRYESSSRSRSPHYKIQISHIARKRTRSKSPEANYTNKFNRSPRRRSRSLEKRISPKYSENKRNRVSKNNGNVNGRPQSTRENVRSPPTVRKDEEKTDVEDKKKDKTPAQPSSKESKTVEVKTNREKTEQELEDELLASTDSESMKDDDDDFKVTLDEKDLDFLEDDEEESENEGRFKSNSSSKPLKNTAASINVKSSFVSKGFDKSRSYNTNYKRSRYEESKRDRKRSRSPIDSSQRSKNERCKIVKKTDVQKLPETSRKVSNKEPVQSTKIIINKEKDKTKEKDKSMFKATFKSVEPPADDKKTDDSKKEDRVRLVRGSVVTRVEKPEKTKELDSKRPAIMKRLGGYIKDSKGNKSWAKEQLFGQLNHNQIIMTGRGLPFLKNLKKKEDDTTKEPTAPTDDSSSVAGSSTTFLDKAIVGRGITNASFYKGITTPNASSGASSMISVGRGRAQFAAIRNSESPVSMPTSRNTGSDDAGSKSLKDGSSSGIVAGRGISASPLNASSGSGAAKIPIVIALSDIVEPIPQNQPEAAAPLPADEVPGKARGVKGRPFQAVTNCIRINCEADTGVFEYEVRFLPQVDSMNFRSLYMRQHVELLGNARTFDGTVLYLPKRLPDDITRLTSISPSDQSNIAVEIIYKRQKRLSECIQLYNVLFERVYKELKYLRVGRKNFDPTAPQVIKQHKLEIWPGYVKSVDQLEGGVMLTLDVSHRVLSTYPAIEVMTDCYKSNPSMFKENAKKALVGKMVTTRYNNKSYRVDDIVFDKNPTHTFTHGNSEISYVDYYKKQYNLDIRDTKQPLLVSRKEVRISGEPEKREYVFMLLPEFCFLVGLTDNMRSNFTVMKDVATYTRVTPMQRVYAYKKLLENVEKTPAAKAILSGWGLSLEKDPLEVTARLLDEEKIVFGRGKEHGAGEKGDFSRYATSNEVLSAIDIIDWILVYVDKDKPTANLFETTLIQISAPTGIRVSPSHRIELRNDKPETYVNEIRKTLSANSKIQIVVVIFPSQRDDRYAAIKRTLCSEIPTPSQVIQTRTLRNETKARSIVQKIILQMNAKLGGTLWSVKIPLKQTMICGIDTSHITGSNPITVGGFVGSYNPEFTRWFSKATIQGKREELVSGLTTAMEQCLAKYKAFNNILPERIILYRDGVSNGELPFVKNHEIEQFKDAFKRIDPDYKPKLTFVVVQKRINTKLFAAPDPKDPSKMINPKPGTILDHTVTSMYLYDFFMIPQHVNQGTTTPSHYIIMEDESNFDADIMQRLTYKLTYLYYNWPGTVRVPAPCQYAHKLADLIGQSIRQQADDKLADKLYYL